MRHVLIMLWLALTPWAAFAQGASLGETDAVARIAECIVEGAPPDWQRLYMVIDLAKPGDDAGEVRYLAKRASEERLVAYTPCDLRKPALILIQARKRLPPERKGWISARLTFEEDGKFSLHYDYPSGK
jgi:hypothetical protein